MIVDDRFWSHVVEKSTGCMEWTASLMSAGYGQVRRDILARTLGVGPVFLAHRYAWYLAYGYLPQKFLLHSCDNKRCVNVAHLREGTVGENSRDAVERGQTCRGETRPLSKLNDQLVQSIRCDTRSNVALANLYGVDSSLISRVRSREIWKHVA